MIKSESAASMAEAAGSFLDALGTDARATAFLPFSNAAARQDWHYVPRERAGLSFRAMDAVQAQRAYELLATGLSLPAFAAATTIIGLEDVLSELEGPSSSRHRADYSVTVFDEPGSAAWGWRFEGHHVSINVTVVDGAVAATPLFLGANPAEVVSASGSVVVRPLAGEEDLALALFGALSDDERADAVLGDVAPDDILTTNAPTLVELPDAAGVRFGDVGSDARSVAETLVQHYLDRLPEPEAEAWWARLVTPATGAFGDIRFAVAGELAHRRPQYYRLAGPDFFVEYDNTQNDANHVHTVLRDPSRDFGADLLRRHRAEHH
jgi:hypothetical protein